MWDSAKTHLSRRRFSGMVLSKMQERSEIPEMSRKNRFEHWLSQEKARELAEQHWKWVETWLHIVYVDAFVHGYKHGVEDTRGERK